MSHLRTALVMCALLAVTGAAAAAGKKAPAPKGDGKAKAAAPKDDPKEKAAAFYEDGVAAYEAGDFPKALAAFTESYNLSGETDLLYNLGACSEKVGDREKAIAYYALYLEEKPDAEDAAEVRVRLDALRSPPEAKPAEPPPPPPPPPPAPAPVEPVTQQGDDEGKPAAEGYVHEAEVDQKKHVGPALLIGLGGLVVATGALTASAAYMKYDDLESTCAPDCSSAKVDGVKGLALGADIQFAVGGAAVVAGIVLLLLEKKKERAAAGGGLARIFAVPAAYADGGGIAVEGRF
jgi:tetratricopeptide (TPR) repeat protein